MVPGVANELDNASDLYYTDMDRFSKSQEFQGSHQSRRLLKSWWQTAQPSIKTAESLRQELLQELPASNHTPEDTREEAIFARILQGSSAPDPSDMKIAASYLRDLSNRVAASVNSH
jgi:hypothetical protein